MKRLFLLCFAILMLTILLVSCSNKKENGDSHLKKETATNILQEEMSIGSYERSTTNIFEDQTSNNLFEKYTNTITTEEYLGTSIQEIITQIPLTEKSTSVTKKDDNMSKKYIVIVKGTSIPNGKLIKYNDEQSCVLLPTQRVFEALGAKVNYDTATVSHIEINGQTYTLNTQSVSLIKDGDDFNYIIPTPGSKIHFECIGDELFLDDCTMKTLFMILGIDAKISVDHQNCYVEIT